MKTSLNIPDEDLEELLESSQALNKTEGVIMAIREFNRRKRMKELSKQHGTFSNFIEISELKKLRGLS